MKHLRQKNCGLTLIELMVAVAILAALALLAVPSMGTYFKQERIRCLVESVSAGMKTAQSEALKRNIPTRFVLTRDPDHWVVQDISEDAPVLIAEVDLSSLRCSAFESKGEGGPTAKGTRLEFNGVGRLLDTTTEKIKSVTTTTGDLPAGIYDLRVEVSNTDGIRVCRPDWKPPEVFTKATDPRICRQQEE